MKKKIADDEIDLIELIRVAYEKKFQVLIVIILSIFLGFFYSSNNKPFYEVNTDIKPILIIDEFKYQTYNSYVQAKSSPVLYGGANVMPTLKNFDEIGRFFLINLFVERLIDKRSLNNILKKSNFIKKENYQNSDDYDKEIESISSGIKVFLEEERTSSWVIKYRTHDLEKWKKFLVFVESFINEEIREHLEKEFNNQLQIEKKLKEYQIEDLENEIENLILISQNLTNSTSYNEQINEAERAKRMLVASLTANKVINRIQTLFYNTPIVSADKFYAAQIIHKSSKYENINKINKGAIILVSGIIGLLIVLFYIYISIAMRKSK
ncbi:Wzz/FepE/Etk N-terminal domain-containing protein [Candidatus Pelagibacter sp.]|nr:Wzz/FepE/Etk N-terminal domain-containing protein [Candidatus Pelagibacter sp.]